MYTVLAPLFVKEIDMSYEGSDGREHVGAPFTALPFWLLIALV